MLQSFHRIGQVSTWTPDWLRPGRVTKSRRWVSSARTQEGPRMNKPFGVTVSDKSGNWDMWLVGAKDHDEAVSFVNAYWNIRGRRTVAYDLTNYEEASKVCVFGSPNVTQHESPHFLPVPAASGNRGVPRRPGILPTVGPLTNVQTPKAPKSPKKPKPQPKAAKPEGKKRGRPPKKGPAPVIVAADAPRGPDGNPGLALTELQYTVNPDDYQRGGPAPKTVKRGRKV